MDLKDAFKNEFECTVDTILQYYPSKEGQEREILGTIIVQLLHEIKLDAEKYAFMDFYKKYLKGSLFLDCTDFTNSQIKEIIEEAPLTSRDKKLALLYWCELKSEDDIANALDIDRKTVRNNVPKISMMLKVTASKLY